LKPSNVSVGVANPDQHSQATALSLPDNHAEIVGRKETRPTYVSEFRLKALGE
jgi:hypothetical protein